MSDLIVRIALYGWPLVVLTLFRFLPPRRAVIAAVVLGTLLLPEVQLSKVSPEAPDSNSFVVLVLKFTKPNTVCFSAMLGAAVFDPRRLLAFRPRWFDVPMLAWSACPFVSDLGVDVGLYDAFAAARDQTLVWGVPYFLGRVYCGDPAGLRDLGLGIVLGGLLYVPFCLWESRFFPNFHLSLYGFFPGDANEAIRWGGYRPVVFMTHGLMTAMWMVVAALTADWLWWTGAAAGVPWWPGRRVLPLRWAALALTLTAAWMRSAGALALGALGLVGLFHLRWLRWPVLLIALLAVSPLYIVCRATGAWTADSVLATLFGGPDERQDESADVKERESSLRFRMINEDRLIPYALERPAFGWGDTGLSRKVPKIKKNEEDIVTDGLWIITLASYGVFGLTALWAAMLLPAVLFFCAYPPRLWSHPALAAGAVAAVVLVLYMIDNLSNAMYNPVYVLLAGGVAGTAGAGHPVRPAQTRQKVGPPPPPAVPRPASPQRPGVLVRRRKG
jgi:hypothetical protein